MNNNNTNSQDIKMKKFINDNIKVGREFVMSMVDTAKSSLAFIDREYNIVMCNDHVLKLFNCRDEKDFSNRLFSFFPAKQRDGEISVEKYKKIIDKAFEMGKNQSEWIASGADGELIVFHANLIMNKGENKKDDLLLLALQDISNYIYDHEKEKEVTAKFKAILDTAPLSINILDKDMNICGCNSQAIKLFGFKNEEDYIKNQKKIFAKIQPNGNSSLEVSDEIVKAVKENGTHKFNWLYNNVEGEEIPAEVVISRISTFEEEESFVAYIKDLRPVFIDNTEENTYEKYFFNRVSDKTLMYKVTELSNEWFFVYDIRTSKIQFYGKNINIDGAKSGTTLEMNRETMTGIVYKEDINAYYRLLENMKNGIYEPIDIRFLQVDGNYRYYRFIYDSIKKDDDESVFLVGKGLDVHEKKILEERSKKDLLTDCYNKISGEHLIADKILKKQDSIHGLFIIDIDNFKAVNDNLGHYFGDKVLKGVAENLKTAFRENDIVARIGGDEFIVFVEDVKDLDLLKRKARKILQVFENTYSGENKDYSISGSVGIAVYPQDGRVYDDIYQSADKALYQAKLQGKNQFVVYNKSLASGTMLNLTKVENAEKIAGNYFDYELIATIFETLYARNGDHESVNHALEYICKEYVVDRAYIFESFDRGNTYSNTFEWCMPGVTQEKNSMQNIDAKFFEDLFNSSIGGLIYSNDLHSIFKTHEAYDIMDKQGIKSFVHSQVKKDGYVPFFIGLDDCTSARVWNEKEINTLQYVAKIISIVFQSEHLREELDELTEYNKISAQISDSADDIVYVSDVNTYELLYLNKAALNLLGNPAEEDWKGKMCYKLLQGKDSQCEFCTNHLLKEDDFYEWSYYNPIFKKSYLLKDKFIRLHGELVRLEIATDVTEILSLEREVEERLEEEKLLNNCIETLHAGDSPQKAIEKILDIIAAFYQAERSYIFERTEDQMYLNNTFEWVTEGVEPFINELQNIPAEAAKVWFDKYEEVGEFYIDSLNEEIDKSTLEYEILSLQGITTLVTAPISDSKGNIVGFIGVDNPKANIKKTGLLRSVSKFIDRFLNDTELLEELNNLSYFDVLTKMKNRNSYRKTLDEIEKAPLESLGVAYIDIKKLRSINEKMGSAFGDTVLKKMGEILESIFGEDVYRVGGDEFVVLKKDIEENIFEEKVGEIKDLIKGEYFEAAIGYTWNKNYENVGNVEGDFSNSKYKAILSENLSREIANDKYVVYFQPQMDMNTRKCVGVEALIRRKNSEGKIQFPAGFIPFYEKEGIIPKIDVFVLETICKEIKEWKDIGIDVNLNFSVNCSRVTINSKDIVKRYSEICEKYLVDKSSIIIEVTETMDSLSDEAFLETINEFINAGFRVSLDDFGSGSSNLFALKSTNFHEIKIDMGLTKDIVKDTKSRVLSKLALELCNELKDATSVAEGVETEEQYDILKEMGCMIGQGYLFDKPMPIDEFASKYLELK